MDLHDAIRYLQTKLSDPEELAALDMLEDQAAIDGTLFEPAKPFFVINGRPARPRGGLAT